MFSSCDICLCFHGCPYCNPCLSKPSLVILTFSRGSCDWSRLNRTDNWVSCFTKYFVISELYKSGLKLNTDLLFLFQSLTVPDSNLRQRRTSNVDLRRGSAVSQRRASRPVTMHMSRKAVEIDASSEGSGTDYSDDEVLMLKKDDGFRPVKGQPGMYYKVGDSVCYFHTQARNYLREYS